MRMPGRGFRLILKIVVSAGLLGFLLTKISTDQLLALIEALDRRLIAAAMGVFLTSNILGSFQWHVLLRSSGVDIPFKKTIRFYFVGLFFNNFLPANIGGDAVKVYDVSRVGNSVWQVVAVTLLDRIIGIFSLCLLASLAVLGLSNVTRLESSWIYLLIFLGCMMPVLGLYFFKPVSGVVRWVVGRLRPLSWDRGGSSILDYLSEFKSRKVLVLKLIALSLVIQSFRVCTHILVAVSLGVQIDGIIAGAFFVFVPLLSLAMIPPVTINGLGIREGLGILLLAQVGIGRTDAFAIEFLTYVVSVFVSLLGLVFFIFKPKLAHTRTEKVPKGDPTVT
ncbi:MAG: flippase-like domain-containing protein [Candidatus Latescibacterota bacterium]|nr:MAG: flippase-like domain-containing protein [Candidatus Latescibacterota bacterium]